MGGQIIDASIIAAPEQRNADREKREIKAGRIPAEWAKKPAKLRQKERDARWTAKATRAKPVADGSPRVDAEVVLIAEGRDPEIDRRHRLIRSCRERMRRVTTGRCCPGSGTKPHRQRCLG
jgi:transposase, IS5 family